MQTSATPVVLLVGGDAPTRIMVRFLLADDGHTVVEAATVAAVASYPCLDEVALLVAIGSESRKDAATDVDRLRRLGHVAPVLLVVHGDDPPLRRRAIASGVRYVVSLPCAAREMQDAARTAMGDYATSTTLRPDIVSAGGLVLCTANRTVVSATSEWSARLTWHETALLAALMRAPGQVISQPRLIDHTWGMSETGDGNGLAVLVRRLRAKLARPEAPHGCIRTIHRQGYAFEARAHPRLPINHPTPAKPRVLVVEDDQATATMVSTVLQDAGYAVTHGVGAEAPMLARQVSPALILLDINMPGMNGVEVQRHLSANPRTADIPVIALSAGYNLRARIAEMVVADYLAKPFDLDELLLRVEKWAGPARAAGNEVPGRPSALC